MCLFSPEGPTQYSVVNPRNHPINQPRLAIHLTSISFHYPSGGKKNFSRDGVLLGLPHRLIWGIDMFGNRTNDKF